MTEMFRVTPIEGKGFGVVATKFIKRGTLILKEEPQIPHVPHVEWPTRYIKSLIKLFYQMSEPDQEEYLKLHNRYEGEFVDECSNIVWRAVMAEENDKQKAEKILKIYGIYRTNKFVDGVSIKTSRFNHSCFPNATTNSLKFAGIYATYDIKEGAEITISYPVNECFSMRKRDYRQMVLRRRGFTCFCDLCKKQDQIPIGLNQTETETKMEELIEEIKNLNVDMSAACKATTLTMVNLHYSPDKCRRHIECYKQLYKFGKERKAHRGDMFLILNKGYAVASMGYQICLFIPLLSKELEEFKKEGISFAKAAEGFVKFLGEGLVQPEDWKETQQNFDKKTVENILQTTHLRLRI